MRAVEIPCLHGAAIVARPNHTVRAGIHDVDRNRKRAERLIRIDGLPTVAQGVPHESGTNSEISGQLAFHVHGYLPRIFIL